MFGCFVCWKLIILTFDSFSLFLGFFLVFLLQLSQPSMCSNLFFASVESVNFSWKFNIDKIGFDGAGDVVKQQQHQKWNTWTIFETFGTQSDSLIRKHTVQHSIKNGQSECKSIIDYSIELLSNFVLVSAVCMYECVSFVLCVLQKERKFFLLFYTIGRWTVYIVSLRQLLF